MKTRSFIVNGRIYYEVTFTKPVDHVDKFDRVMAFTDHDVEDKYAAYLTLRSDLIDVLGQTISITVIRKWEVSIRPCELENFARLVEPRVELNSGGPACRALTHYLMTSNSTQVDLMGLTDGRYEQVKAKVTERLRDPRIFPSLDKA